MRRDQLVDTKRGVDLLLAHLKNETDSLDTALATQDVKACEKCADPLVNVATILIRQLRDATSGTIETAIATARAQVPSGISSEDIDSVATLVAAIVSSRKPEPMSIQTVMVALIAQYLALGAATELARVQNKHVNAVVATLRTRLNSPGDDVQLSDRDAANAASEEYAMNQEMRQARQATVFNITYHWDDAANVLAVESENADNPEACNQSLNALTLLSKTFVSLTAAIYQLVAQTNMYPANSLLRQLVEAEFILWKFAQDDANTVAWLNSTPDERRASWRPSTIYRDGDNDYRQKDYAQHCEMGGHPTPIGTRLTLAMVDPVRIEAPTLCDTITHSREGWQHLMNAVSKIDQTHSTVVSTKLAAFGVAFENTMTDYAAVERYGYATAFFSDPIDI